MRARLHPWLPALVLWLSLPALAEGEQRHGFDLSKATVPRDEILAGGPPRDGIRSVDEPEFATPETADWVAPNTPVLGVEIGGRARAYPVHVIEYHQIVNDDLGGTAVAVTYDPLTGVPRAFRRVVQGRMLSFGVSGLIYRSGFLLYDRETESLWSQFLGKAIAGPMAGVELVRLPIRQETTAGWLGRHADSRLLARPAPMKIDYRHSPFSTYWVSERILFPVPHEDRRYHPKELVVGVVADGRARAYLGSIVTREGGILKDELAGKSVRIGYDTHNAVFNWDVPEGVDVTEAYWFAWKAFHPDTEIWREEPGLLE